MIEIIPSMLSGKVLVPSSKSIGHRALICAALSKGKSKISNISFSEDIYATIRSLEVLGRKVSVNGDSVEIETVSSLGLKKKERVLIDACESGSTLRFIIPIAMCFSKNTTFVGRGKLVERPLDTFYKIFDEKNIVYKNDNSKLPLNVNSYLTSGVFHIDGHVSSQFLSGLLFSLPLLEGDSEIILNNALESRPYIDLTLDMLANFGIEVVNNNYESFYIKGNQEYKATDIVVEADYSQAAFWLVSGALGNNIEIAGLNRVSKQGDMEIINILKKYGYNVNFNNDIVTVNCVKDKIENQVIDVKECPDLVPVLVAFASVLPCETKIINCGRLKHKESDRLNAPKEELEKLDADIKIIDDTIHIKGVSKLKGASLNSHNDHRIAMALAVISSLCDGNIILNGHEAVNKSYPKFWEDFKQLGGKIIPDII